ncbi:hypothetical protein BsIDN1_17870 [Bacillus safensis]|uniref:Uncharacterized protein n=1 Tax=Bacillus safensis TaxID=561879 RepID=A0A5S9M899_BACIA|nr:hypothetical protein BsIDN1_17870 [Bacillus safensis]
MGKGRIRVEERIKAETDAEMFKATLLDQAQKKSSLLPVDMSLAKISYLNFMPRDQSRGFFM